MRFQRPLRAAAAVAFAASLVCHAGIYLYYAFPGRLPDVELGFDDHYVPDERVDLIRGVYKGSPAEEAGLRAGDRIAAIDGEPLNSAESQPKAWMLHKPGEQVHLTIRRPGADHPIYLTATFRRRPGTNTLTRTLQTWFPLPFIVVGLAVLFLRQEDPNAWLLALAFGGVVVSRGLLDPSPRPAWWPVVMAYQSLMTGIVGPLFCWFQARFTAPSFDRRWPWLKWILLGLGLVGALGSIRTGGIHFPIPSNPWLDGSSAGVLFIAACLAIGMGLMIAGFHTHNAEARRKTRILFWGTVISLGPNIVRLSIESSSGARLPAWVDNSLPALLILLPLSFAYAVVVHRALEIPVLLRRSARYLLVQRGFTVLLAGVSIAVVLSFAVSFPRLYEMNQTAGITLGAVFGTTLLWSGTEVHKRVSGRIDRAFFRSAYDARRLLEDLAEKTGTVTGRAELERLLEFHLAAALKPRFLRVQLQPGSAEAGEQPECVVPILNREGKQLGLLLLGPRLSEEPYSGEDRRLLASIASQAATALENIRLAEEIAARIDGERRAAREMEIARDVQARLLPQGAPRLKTLECGARCIQARAVGGDYYDFLDLGGDSAGLVLADVSGKGVHAALLVAHLQACLRTAAAMMPRDPVAILRQANQMLYRSTAAQHFATLFFGIYDDAAHELLYVNCGHNPPIWLRADGSVGRLEATATVIGAFDRWDGSAGRARLESGDLLAIFSDGITEAPRGEEDFGERRLIEELRACSRSPVDVMISAVLHRVQDFSQGVQADDLTLLLARAR
ncbi:MAG TPA: SpoIIE family protein phosphatase [Bryobacteraceae bacterium]|nr:SpoIIE family protein phosphatase [Bryobacteraceae bacterium]